jgi:hypothetical protein
MTNTREKLKTLVHIGLDTVFHIIKLPIGVLFTPLFFTFDLFKETKTSNLTELRLQVLETEASNRIQALVTKASNFMDLRLQVLELTRHPRDYITQQESKYPTEYDSFQQKMQSATFYQDTFQGLITTLSAEHNFSYTNDQVINFSTIAKQHDSARLDAHTKTTRDI